MSRPDTPSPRGPFTRRTLLAVVISGVVLFLVVLWMIGAGLAHGSANDGGNHAEGTGLNGFAALSRYLEATGSTVVSGRSPAALRSKGLVVLTPPAGLDPEDLDTVLADRRFVGPTLLILPKWGAIPIPKQVQGDGGKEGWVLLGDAQVAAWTETVATLGPLDARIDNSGGRWEGLGLRGALPSPDHVQSIISSRIVPLVRDSRGQALAAYLDSDGVKASLARAAGRSPEGVAGSAVQPVVIVAEPDLLNNQGFASESSARLASAILAAIDADQGQPVTFDLTLNGHARAANLLTLAFTPPFVSATLCLIFAALFVGWRAFLRFGAVRAEGPAIAFGKRALVANAAGLVRRSGRRHLIAEPYARRLRARIATLLGVSVATDDENQEAAIDAALARRDPDGAPFSYRMDRLRSARSPHDLISAAQDLRALERTLST